MRNIKYIFVHCTAGPQTQSIETIQNYWKKSLGWKSPGYHYIIKPDGEIVQLLDESKASNGVAGYNSVSINVCYIGGVDKQGKPLDNRTEAQKTSLLSILKELKSRYPKATIMGHRDIWGTDQKKWKKWCPCFDAKSEYKDITATPITYTEDQETPIKAIDIEDIPNNAIQEKPKESIWSKIKAVWTK